MFFRFFLLFTILPVLELYVIIKVGSSIGALSTIALIVLTGILGAYLAKSEGMNVYYNIRQALREGRMPANELMDAFFVLAGGIALVSPGFISDIIGITMIMPPTRFFYRKWAGFLIKKRIATGLWRVR